MGNIIYYLILFAINVGSYTVIAINGRPVNFVILVLVFTLLLLFVSIKEYKDAK